MSRYVTVIFKASIIGLLLTACGAATVNPATITRPVSSTATTEPATPAPSSPTSTTSPTPAKKTFSYKVIYQADGFTIREALLGANAIWKDDYQMPARIENTVKNLGVGREMACDQEPASNAPCSQTLELGLANGGTDQYTFRLANLNGGAGVLLKNNRLLWSGLTNGGASFAILSSKRIGDEIAFDYAKSNWGSNLKPFWVIDSILYTAGNTVVLIPDAFAPNAIRGKLAYFKVMRGSQILIFDGRQVGVKYDEVFNQLCCWHGPPIQIAADGEAIDFFAQKGRDWYHVQAGYLNNSQ